MSDFVCFEGETEAASAFAQALAGMPAFKACHWRTCQECQKAWRSSSCPHDHVQEACPQCGVVPQPVGQTDGLRHFLDTAADVYDRSKARVA